ncbi:DUF411 domain-containing protein [Proteobacteria bacterium 005FR1]|nr:DUF411 domain-containing protein [Proteobacteria bacterium 005FR1]
MSVSKKIFLLVGLSSAIALTACDTETQESSAAANQNVVAATQTEAAAVPATAVALDVYKSETCGCCGAWVDHAKQNSFSVDIHHPIDLNATKQEHGIAPRYQSCHTSVTPEGYVFEGHVPAKFIHQFLAEKPEGAIGLAVPGMPMGSPGMEVGDRFTPYDVLLLKKDGSSEVYASVASTQEQF